MSGPDLMPPALRERLFSLRCRAKRGEHMSPEDMEFFSEMLRKYPIQYRAMNAEIH